MIPSKCNFQTSVLGRYLADSSLVLGVLGALIAVERKGVKWGQRRKRSRSGFGGTAFLSVTRQPLRHQECGFHPRLCSGSCPREKRLPGCSPCLTTFSLQFSEHAPAPVVSAATEAMFKMPARVADLEPLLLINSHSLPRKGQRLVQLRGGGQNSVREKLSSRATFQDITQDC